MVYSSPVTWMEQEISCFPYRTEQLYVPASSSLTDEIITGIFPLVRSPLLPRDALSLNCFAWSPGEKSLLLWTRTRPFLLNNHSITFIVTSCWGSSWQSRVRCCPTTAVTGPAEHLIGSFSATRHKTRLLSDHLPHEQGRHIGDYMSSSM